MPAGKYARSALAASGAWEGVAARVVSGDNVRAALAWVATGEAEVAVVYATDALVEPRVRVAFAFPADSHEAIVYPAAVVKTSSHAAEADAFLGYCTSPPSRALFGAAGFAPPP